MTAQALTVTTQYELSYYAGEEVPMEVWRQCYPFIRDAAQYSNGEFVGSEVLEWVRKGDQQLWVVWERGTVVWTWVTEIQIRNGRKVCQVTAAGGTKHEAGWDFWPLMGTWMKQFGIEKAEVWCRPAVARLLKRKANFVTKYEVLAIKPEVL